MTRVFAAIAGAVLLGVMAVVVPAAAQEKSGGPDWRAYAEALRQQRDTEAQRRGDLEAQMRVRDAELQAQITAMAKTRAELDAYLKACGDKPGCTQPIPKPAAK